MPSPDETKASLLARIGREDRPGLVLSAHTDVVPVAGQDWKTPPFQATLKDGRIHGRGASDMKGFIAVVLAHASALAVASEKTPVLIALSYDEEIGCQGAPDLVAALASLPVRPGLCLVGEPTGMRVASAHKGKLARRLRIRGETGHSAYPHRAASALYRAAALATGLEDLAAHLSGSPLDDSFDPPFSTVHAGVLRSGEALNLVPDHAVLDYEIRYLPGEDLPELEARIDALIARETKRLKGKGEIVSEPIAAYPALGPDQSTALVDRVRDWAGDRKAPIALSFGTEAGLYAQAGIPTLVCGPGDIARAHKANEWIGLDEMAAAGTMLERMAESLSVTPL